MVSGVPVAVGADCHIHPIVGSLEMAHKDPLPVSKNLPCWAGKLKKKIKNKERTLFEQMGPGPFFALPDLRNPRSFDPCKFAPDL